MEVIGRALTTYQIDPDGEAFRLHFEGADGQPGSLVLPVECLKSLLMTLPHAMEQALQAKYGDDTLRLVYPLGDWSLQAAEGTERLIMTLSTPDHFTVSFALRPGDAGRLARSLDEGDGELGRDGRHVN
jgi:hypothetical protein